MIKWIFGQDTHTVSESYVQGDFDFEVEAAPKIPETNSNINILCYADKSRLKTIHVKVKWWRLKNGQLREIEGLKGNTYHCEPSDLGSKIKALVTSLDGKVKGTAEVWFCPVKFEAGLKQTIISIVDIGRTALTTKLVKQGKQHLCQLSVNSKQLGFGINGKTEFFEYSLSDPRIEVSHRDTNKVWVRFQHEVEQRLDLHLGIDKQSIQSCRSIRSKDRNIYRTNLVDSNKLLEIQFSNRVARDTFLFAMKSFGAQKQLKGSLILERLQKTDLNQQQLCKQFFQFESLKDDVVRLDLLNKDLILDRDRKVQDLKNMEQEVSSVTNTYLRIIEQKFKDRLDLNQSYSMLSQKNQDLQEKKLVRALKEQNQLLKTRLTDLESQIQYLKSYDADIALTPGRGTFEKKPVSSTQIPAIAQLSKMNLMLAAQNMQLKHQNRNRPQQKQQDKNLLTSFQESETARKDVSKRSNKVKSLANKIDVSIRQAKERLEANLQGSSMLANSMDTETEMQLLQEKFLELRIVNDRLLQQNQTLLQNIQVCRGQVLRNETQFKKQLQAMHKVTEVERESFKREIERIRSDCQRAPQATVLEADISHDNGEVLRLMQQLQLTAEEKELVIRDIICLEGAYTDLASERDDLQDTVSKLLKKTQEQQTEIQLIKRSSSALNRSRDLSVDMSHYDAQMIQMLKTQMQCMLKDNQRLSQLCQRYQLDLKGLRSKHQAMP